MSLWCRLGLHRWRRVPYVATQKFPPTRVPVQHQIVIRECRRCDKASHA